MKIPDPRLKNRTLPVRSFKITAVMLCFMVPFLISGCGKKVPKAAPEEAVKKPAIRLIAVLPVDNRSSDPLAARILRERVLQEIFHRGYPKIPFAVMDEKLAKNYKDAARMAPQTAGALLGADAVLYCTLLDWRTSILYLYARTKVSARFELRSAKTGETLWKAGHEAGKRNYDITRERLEMETLQAYEPAIHEIVDRAFQTFPDGPDFIGRPPSKGGCFLWNWF
jgi:hypothetical protein